MQNTLQNLKSLLAEISDLRYAAALLGWDQQTYMPVGGAEARGNQLALLEKLAHERATSPELGKLLDDSKQLVADSDPDSDDARLVKVSTRHFEKATRVPASHVVEFAQATTMGQQAWMSAREKSDFSIFQHHLEKIVALRQEYAAFFPNVDHPYDALLDDFEPGMKTAEVKTIFEDLRPKQVELIKEIAEKPQVDDAFLHQHFDAKKQWEFGVKAITKFGFDWDRGRQDKAHHPFTTSFSINDVRITTRVDESFFNTMIFGTFHECGHALYGLGAAQELERTGLEDGASMAVHESQSRMWENLVGRSMAMWEYFYPQLQKDFPSLLSIPLEKFYKAINMVKPSLIRVEADEATYNLHIMLRFELELALLEGTVNVKDLPGIWKEKMDEYLGIVPADDSKGVLQDIHWSGGSIGYFPTYALGNLVSAQLWEKINTDIPDLEDQIRKGEFHGLLNWLRKNIHRHGAKFEPQELILKVTGSKITSAPYIKYLTNKFKKIYNL